MGWIELISTRDKLGWEHNPLNLLYMGWIGLISTRDKLSWGFSNPN